MSKVVLITGCSSGIGRAFAENFAKRGFNVIATARKPENVEPFESGKIVLKKLDVTNEEDILSVKEFALANNLVPDILINNAGYGLMGPAVELPMEALKKQFETNLFGAVRLIQVFTPLMVEKGGGTIVNISSISGIMSTPFSSAYCATKAALTAYSDSLRMELAPFGIKVVIVQPGAISSKFGDNAEKELKNVLKEDSLYSKYFDAILDRAKASQKNATPVDKFVEKVVGKIIKPNPPAIIRGGKLSFLVPRLKKYLPVKTLDSVLTKVFKLK